MTGYYLLTQDDAIGPALGVSEASTIRAVVNGRDPARAGRPA